LASQLLFYDSSSSFVWPISKEHYTLSISALRCKTLAKGLYGGGESAVFFMRFFELEIKVIKCNMSSIDPNHDPNSGMLMGNL
jgi:hypothetical protein